MDDPRADAGATRAHRADSRPAAAGLGAIGEIGLDSPREACNHVYMNTKTVPLTFRVPEDQRNKLRAALIRHGVTLQDWGQCVVAEHLGLKPREDTKAAVKLMLEAE